MNTDRTSSPPLGASLGSPIPGPADLSDEATRRRLTPAALEGVRRLADLWRIGGEDAAKLMDVSLRTWFRIRKGSWTQVLSHDQATRVSLLVGIYKGLNLHYALPLADEWPSLPNRNPIFQGGRPLDVMIAGGIPAMLLVRRHVDAMRGGL